MFTERQSKLPIFLAVIVTAVIIWSGINPVFPEVWIAEIIPIILIFAPLVLTYGKFKFSNTAYLFMSCWLILHTIGSHYTFANVPFEWFSDLIGSERNHFDRFAHFSIGFYAFAIAEFVTRKKYANPFLAGLFGLSMIMAIAAGYEIIEWWYAVLAGGEAGIEFLGSQGDIWDAQQDMFADTMGAIVSLIVFYIKKPYLKR